MQSETGSDSICTLGAKVRLTIYLVPPLQALKGTRTSGRDSETLLMLLFAPNDSRQIWPLARIGVGASLFLILASIHRSVINIPMLK